MSPVSGVVGEHGQKYLVRRDFCPMEYLNDSGLPSLSLLPFDGRDLILSGRVMSFATGMTFMFCSDLPSRVQLRDSHLVINHSLM